MLPSEGVIFGSGVCTFESDVGLKSECPESRAKDFASDNWIKYCSWAKAFLCPIVSNSFSAALRYG